MENKTHWLTLSARGDARRKFLPRARNYVPYTSRAKSICHTVERMENILALSIPKRSKKAHNGSHSCIARSLSFSPYILAMVSCSNVVRSLVICCLLGCLARIGAFSTQPRTPTAGASCTSFSFHGTLWCSASDKAASNIAGGPKEIVARRILVTGDVQGGYLRACILNEVRYLIPRPNVTKHILISLLYSITGREISEIGRNHVAAGGRRQRRNIC